MINTLSSTVLFFHLCKISNILYFCREEEITWFMEVICYGLSLPLSEHDTVKDCVNVYCEWLSALLPGEPKTW